MESNKFIDYDDILMRYFEDEYMEKYLSTWEEIIEKEDLGIIYIDEKFHDKHWVAMYDIVDAKKWMLSKIKYGI